MKPLQIHFYTAFVHEQGTYFRFHNLARGLQDLGQQVTVFACDQNWRARRRTEERDGVEYQILPVLPTARVFDATTDPLSILRNAVQRRPPCDIAHLFQPFPAAALAWKCAQARAHFWDWDDLWAHETGPRPLRPLRMHWSKPVTAWMEKTLPKTADHVTAIDHFLADLATSRGAKRTSILYNPSFVYDVPSRAATRADFGLHMDGLYVGFMGYTTWEMDWIVESLARNLTRFPQLRFVLCGRNDDLPEMDPELSSRIDFLGRVTQPQARAIAGAMDIALLPMEDTLLNQSRFPVKFSEYLMAGTPVLASEIGECGLLADQMPGVLKAGTTRAEWSRAFDAAIEMAETDRLPRVERKPVLNAFASDVVCNQLVELYRQTLCKSPPETREHLHGIGLSEEAAL